MATRGRKPLPSAIRDVTARRGRKPPNPAEPKPNGRPSPPVSLTGRPLALWRRFISPAWWLTAADSQIAYMHVHLAAEFEADPAAMTASRIAQLRALANELGLTPSARTRLGADSPPEADDAGGFRF